MASGDMTGGTAGTMATWTPEVWSSLANLSYHTVVVLPDLMDRRWEPELGVGRGDLVNVPAFTQKGRSYVNKRATFGTLGGLTFNYATESQTQIVVNQMAIYAFRIPVEASMQAMAKYEALLVDAAGPSIAEQVDYELASDDTNGLDLFTAIGADNVDVTEDVILEGETNLNNVNAPLTGRFFVMSPATRQSLMQIEVFRNQLYKSSVGNIPGDKGQGYMGQLYTLDCYMSNNLESGTAGKKNAIWHQFAIAFIEQQSVKVEKGLNIADGLINEYAAYNCYGFKVIKSTFGREVDGK